MVRRLSWSLFTFASAVSVVLCVAKAGSAATAAPARAATAPSTVPSTRPLIGIVFSAENEQLPLSPDQCRAILAAAAGAGPRNQDAWFLFVVWNFELKRQPELSGLLFYTPRAASPRLRKGLVARVRGTGSEVRVQGKDLTEYVQVSPAGQPFGGDLQLPTEDDLPCRAPRDATGRPARVGDDDVVRLIDFAREALSKQGWRPGPFTSITVDGATAEEATFRLKTGYDAGAILEVTRAGGEFRQVGDVDWWVF